MVRMSRDDVRRVLGDVDDLVVAQAIATEADEGTLLKALLEVEREVRDGETPGEISPDPAHQRARALIFELMYDDFIAAAAEYATD